jgi:hypothetical protein
MVADLADVIRSKEAADREKDRAVLPILRQVLERSRLNYEREKGQNLIKNDDYSRRETAPAIQNLLRVLYFH